MISSNLPANMAHLVAPSSAPGQQSPGHRGFADRHTPIKPIAPMVAAERPLLSSRHTQQDIFSPSAPESNEDAFVGYGPSQRGPSQGTQEESEPNSRKPRDGATEARKLEQDQQVIKRLSARDLEVRAHEQAHASVGGQYAGAAQFSYERGPDGVRYAVGGEVPIDVGREASPEATLRKAQVVKRAALAPAEPSPQDRRVATEATRMEAIARQQLAVERARQDGGSSEVSGEQEPIADTKAAPAANETSKELPNNSRRVRPDPEIIGAVDTSLSSRLLQGIANTTLSSREQGTILDQIV